MPKLQEAIIGASFVFAASTTMVLLSSNPHGAEHFQDILAGQILWSSWSDVLRLAIFYLPILLLWFKFKNRISKSIFYFIFAVVITNSVQTVGIYLVFSFLILPSFIALNFRKYRSQIIAAYLAAFLGLLIGLIISSFYDYPTGPMIVSSLFGINFIWFLFRKIFLKRITLKINLWNLISF